MVRIKHRYLLLNLLYPDGNDGALFGTTNPVPTSKLEPDVLSHLAFHQPTPPSLTPQLFLSHLRNHISIHFGDIALGLTNPSLKCIYFAPATSTAIIRCPRAMASVVWASLTYMTSVPVPSPGGRRGVRDGGSRDEKRDCMVRVVRVSGTIRKSEEELIRRAKEEVVRMRRLEEQEGRDVLDKLLGGSEDKRGAPKMVEQRIDVDEDGDKTRDEADDETESGSK